VTSITDDPSDAKFKLNPTNYFFDLNKFSSIQIKKWDWNIETNKNGEKGYGFIAQDLEKIYPQIVIMGKRTEANGYKDTNKSRLVDKNVTIKTEVAFKDATEISSVDVMVDANVTIYFYDANGTHSKVVVQKVPSGMKQNKLVLKKGVAFDATTGKFWKNDVQTEKVLENYVEREPIFVETNYKTIDYPALISLLTEKIQQLDADINFLKTKIK
ncbi:MAG: tail fiber domain-containing protein, partial [Magnetococcus sp. YQC-3]